eukprot:1057887-Lingulodinium_polyedra.AAC.1
MVMVSGASLHGWGLASSHWHPWQVAEVGRIRERDRFRRPGPLGARVSALGAAGFAENDQGTWEPVGDGVEWEVNASFDE